jgi:hypothetical protein
LSESDHPLLFEPLARLLRGAELLYGAAAKLILVKSHLVWLCVTPGGAYNPGSIPAPSGHFFSHALNLRWTGFRGLRFPILPVVAVFIILDRAAPRPGITHTRTLTLE